jgi:hypothetical protein
MMPMSSNPDYCEDSQFRAGAGFAQNPVTSAEIETVNPVPPVQVFLCPQNPRPTLPLLYPQHQWYLSRSARCRLELLGLLTRRALYQALGSGCWNRKR